MRVKYLSKPQENLIQAHYQGDAGKYAPIIKSVIDKKEIAVRLFFDDKKEARTAYIAIRKYLKHHDVNNQVYTSIRNNTLYIFNM